MHGTWGALTRSMSRLALVLPFIAACVSGPIMHDEDGFAPEAQYAKAINVCLEANDCNALCVSVFALTADDVVDSCTITKYDRSGAWLHVRYYDQTESDGYYDDDGDWVWTDDGDDGSYDDGGYDDGSDTGDTGDDGGDTGDDGGDTGDSGDDGGDDCSWRSAGLASPRGDRLHGDAAQPVHRR